MIDPESGVSVKRTVVLELVLNKEHVLGRKGLYMADEDPEEFEKAMVAVINNLLKQENEKASWAAMHIHRSE